MERFVKGRDGRLYDTQIDPKTLKTQRMFDAQQKRIRERKEANKLAGGINHEQS